MSRLCISIALLMMTDRHCRHQESREEFGGDVELAYFHACIDYAVLLIASAG